MSTNDKDHATVVRWTCAFDAGQAMSDAQTGSWTKDKAYAEKQAKALGPKCNVWKCTSTITVERMPNEETGE